MRPERSSRPVVRWLGIAVILAGSSSSRLTASPIERHPTVRAVLTIPPQEELAALTLDADIWEASPGSPPDIRIVDQEGISIPHLLRKAGEQQLRTVRENCQTTVEFLQEHADNRIDLSVSLDEGAPFATGIDFATPLKDFERQITVQGIHEDDTQELLVEGALIYDYSRFADVRRTHITLPPNRFRRFTISIGNVTDEQPSPRRQISRTYEQGEEVRLVDQGTVTARPFRMNRVQLYAERQAGSHTVEQVVSIEPRSWGLRETTRDNQSVIEIETHNEPITGFLLVVGDPNFTRRVRVEVPSGSSSDTWQAIANATISRIAFRNLLDEALGIHFPERRSPRFRLIIENHDSPPLEIRGVEAQGPLWQAVYIARAGQEAHLYYGATPSQPPRYDTAPIRRVIDGGYTPLTLGLGEPTANPHYRKPGFALTNLVGSRAFFLASVAIMVAVLAIALVRAARSLP